MTQLPDIQYRHQVKKGSTVTYGNRDYRVQDDGKGFLHIIVQENGTRRKVSIDSLPFFTPGTKEDYIFNGWFQSYTFEQYLTYLQPELHRITALQSNIQH